jgi:hypothetical protein
MNVESVRNFQEHAVFELVMATAPRFPELAADENLLADVACVALNALPPRYIRHVVDMHFFMTNRERQENDVALQRAVESAFEYIAKRIAHKSRTA